MSFTDTIGYFAAFLTTASFLPQAVRVWKSRETRAISLGMYAVFTTGAALWLAYGVLSGSWPVLVANAVTFVLSLTILVMKIRYEQR